MAPAIPARPLSPEARAALDRIAAALVGAWIDTDGKLTSK